jgi:3-hydroxybutyryl-CoA dehydrogenase
VSRPETIAVIGAGTMGAGIAQLAAVAGARTALYDRDRDALGRGLELIASNLERQVAKGRMSAEDATAARGRLVAIDNLGEISDVQLVVEAAPERLDLKLDLFRELDDCVAKDCVLATNTSSLSVTEIASVVSNPGRVVGLHFFNPAPLMRLVEVVAGEASASDALALARGIGEAMGKCVIDAQDIAGFLVNRVNRPYSLEALRLVEEGVATFEQVDRITRMGGGFRMGPFELMDLIGLETNHAVAESLFRATYGEPRYRPSPLTARKIAAGRLGRKTGCGWYTYAANGTSAAKDPAPPPTGGGDGRPLRILGDIPLAGEIADAARGGGWLVGDHPDPWLTIDCDGRGEPPGTPRLLALVHGSLHRLDPTAAGFHSLGPFEGCHLIELTSTVATPAETVRRSEEFVRTLGRHPEHVGDAPGLVLGRIVCQLINEAAFLIGEGNGSPQDVDAGMTLGVNHPQGPVSWSQIIGTEHARSVLEALGAERSQERYRVAPLLTERAALGAALG